LAIHLLLLAVVSWHRHPILFEAWVLLVKLDVLRRHRGPSIATKVKIRWLGRGNALAYVIGVNFSAFGIHWRIRVSCVLGFHLGRSLDVDGVCELELRRRHVVCIDHVWHSVIVSIFERLLSSHASLASHTDLSSRGPLNSLLFVARATAAKLLATSLDLIPV